MTTGQVKTTNREAILAILNATKDGGLPVEDRIVLLAGIVRQIMDDLAQEQQTLGCLVAVVKELAHRQPGPIYSMVGLDERPYVPTDGGSLAAHSMFTAGSPPEEANQGTRGDGRTGHRV